MPLITEFCRLGACERCTNPACTHSCHTGIKLILVVPPCSFCWDQDAAVEATTTWFWQASLCMDCAERIGGDRSGWRELQVGPAQPPLITEEQAGAYVESQTFKRARPTYMGRPQPKHEYVLLRRSADPELHLRVVSYIRAVGDRRRWHGGDYHTYWTHGDYEYWAMAPRHVILNRRHLSWPTTA
jgi:hypothetical protein